MVMAHSTRAHLKFDRSDITKVKADICICPIHRSRDLKIFNISSQILRAAGSSIQDELYKDSCKELEMGEVVETGPGQLTNFNKIMFISLRHYMDGNEMYLQQSLLEIFQLAVAYQYTSVALPALGTGGLEYPVEKVAKVTFDAVGLHNLGEFLLPPSLQTVHVVLSKDDKDETLVQTYLRICLTGSFDMTDSNASDTKNSSQSKQSASGFSQPSSAAPQGNSSTQTGAASNSITKTGPLQALLALAQRALLTGLLTFSVGVLKVRVHPAFHGNTVGVGITLGVDVEILSKFLPKSLIDFFHDNGITL